MTKEPRRIPSNKIYSNETAAKKEVLGVWMSGPYKHDMLQNYRKIIMDGRLSVPKIEPFYTKFILEHDGVVVQKVQGTSNYLKFKEPVGGTIDLLDSMGLALLHLSKDVSPPYLGFGVSKLKI